MVGRVRTLAVAAALAAGLLAPGVADAAPSRLVDAWTAAPASSAAEATPPVYTDRTLRLIVHPHASGTSLRVRLSNSYGTEAITVGGATIGPRGSNADVGATHQLTFGGSTTVTLAAHGEAQSDELRLPVTANQDLAVSLYLPGTVTAPTWHSYSLQTSYASTPGDHSAEAAGTAFTSTLSVWPLLSGIVVRTKTAPGTIVTLGDSITDGAKGTANANGRWPDILANRLLAASPGRAYSVANEGLSGNKVTLDSPRSGQAAVTRLDRDVLQRKNVRYVVLLEGVNDIRNAVPVTADQVIAGYRDIIARVHARCVKIIGATLTPIKGTPNYGPAVEAERTKINDWIRTPGNFDAYIDFAKITEDPADPLRFLPAYDSGDHLHPGQAGYAAMGNSLDLALFAS